LFLSEKCSVASKVGDHCPIIQFLSFFSDGAKEVKIMYYTVIFVNTPLFTYYMLD